MSIFVVGGLAISVEGPPAVSWIVRERYALFLDETRAAEATLHVDAGGDFSADFKLGEREAGLRIEAGRQGEKITLGGSARGWFDAERGMGVLEGAVHLGQVDALMRLALSLLLPRRGAMLLHGAAVPARERASGLTDDPATSGEVVVLVGASGAGKSTLASALGATMGDELVVVHPQAAESPHREEGKAVNASGTPYWRGRPDRAAVSMIACLQRRQSPAAGRLFGSAALRELAPHVVRYVPDELTDRAIFTLLGAVCSQVPVMRLACPEGPALVPFVRRAIAEDAQP